MVDGLVGGTGSSTFWRYGATYRIWVAISEQEEWNTE